MDEPTDSVASFEVALEQSAAPSYVLRLYVAGTTVQSNMAILRLKKFCEGHLQGRYQIEVVDVYQQPSLAKADQILAVPTLIRKLPLPPRKIIGDLSNEERVFAGLKLKGSLEKQAEAKNEAKKTRRKRSLTR
jgi:circadian clock protein KaiB